MKIRLIVLVLGVALIISSCDLGRNTRDRDDNYRPRWNGDRERYYGEDRRPMTQPNQGPMQPNNYYYYITPERKNESNSSANKTPEKFCEIEDIEFKSIPSINIKAIEASGEDYKAKSALLIKEVARLKRHILETRSQVREHIENARKNCQY